MRKRLVSVFVLVALASGLLAVAATPAIAATDGNIRSFLPDATTTPAGEGLLLSDRFDGTDSGAHLTAVATPSVDRVDWLVCPTGADGGDGLINFQTELAQCNIEAGSDSTPVVVTTGGPFATPNEAYDVVFDIPSSLDLFTRDMLVLGCAGAGRVVEGASKNCIQELVENVVFDDSAGGTGAQTSSGEMVQICTVDTAALTGGPGVAPFTTASNQCQVDTNDDGDITDAADVAPGTTARTDVDARFKSWKHGDPVPNDGFVVRATTDPDSTVLTMDIETAPAGTAGPDSATSPSTATTSDDCTLIDSFTTFKRWECLFTDAEIPATEDNSNVAIWIRGAGAGTPATARRDVHYSLIVTRAPTTAAIHLGTPTVDNNCGKSPDLTETVSADTTGDTGQSVQGCFLDQFTQLIAADFAFQISPVDTFASSTDPAGFCNPGPDAAVACTATGEGLELDANTDNFWEAVQGTLANMGGDLIAGQAVELEQAQTYTITFCRDANLNGACATTETPLITATKTVTAGAAETVRLVFRSRTPTAPTRTECFTGPTTAQNNVGDRDNLLACVFDNFLNLRSTLPADDAVRLDFAITPAGGGEVTATRFPTDSPPPADTDAGGFANAVVEAFCRDVNADGVCDQGNDIITVTLREADGGSASSSVQKRVTGGAPRPGEPGKCPGFEASTANQIVGTAASETLTGTNGDDIICGLDGNDVINGLGGNDILLGGNGNDTIRGGAGNDVIFGQVGNDLMFGHEGADRISGGDGADRASGGDGNDRLWGGGGEDRLWGLAGNDIIYGNLGDDPNLRGGTGNDFIVGGSGNDGIVGDQGNDKGYGQSGNDRLFFRDGQADARVNGGGGVDLCGFDRGLDIVVFCP